MPHGVEPVTRWKAKVVRVQFDESTAKQWRPTKSQGKRVSFELKMPTENGEAKRQKLKHKQQQMIHNTTHFSHRRSAAVLQRLFLTMKHTISLTSFIKFISK